MANVINFGETIKYLGENEIKLPFPSGNSTLELDLEDSYYLGYYDNYLSLGNLTLNEFCKASYSYIIRAGSGNAVFFPSIYEGTNPPENGVYLHYTSFTNAYFQNVRITNHYNDSYTNAAYIIKVIYRFH